MSHLVNPQQVGRYVGTLPPSTRMLTPETDETPRQKPAPSPEFLFPIVPDDLCGPHMLAFEHDAKGELLA